MSALTEELEGIDLGDTRRNRRSQRVLEQLGGKPTVSIPSACGGWTETRAAYRLFDQAQVTAEKVLAPHIARTVERIRVHPRVLCIQDTSELDYTGKSDIQGLGPLNYESRQGLYLHPTLAITPDRLPLGLLHIHSWAREPDSLGREKDSGRPLEEKESVRWVDGYQQVNELADSLTDTALTYIADREGDIYDLFVEAPCPESAADWLVRGQHDRVLAGGGTLRQALAQAPVLTETTFKQPGCNGRTARTVFQQLKTVRVTLKAPGRPDRILPDVEVTALLATEPHPPAGEKPAAHFFSRGTVKLPVFVFTVLAAGNQIVFQECGIIVSRNAHIFLQKRFLIGTTGFDKVKILGFIHPLLFGIFGQGLLQLV